MPGVLTESMNNNLRPYAQGLEQHDATVATIILYTKEKNDLEEADAFQKDYLTSFDKQVKNISTKDTEKTSKDAEENKKTIKKFKLDGTLDYYGVFNNFSLIGVSERKEQIVKVHNNFGGNWNAFFFGDRPSIYSFTGFFLDSKRYPYYQEFMVAYDRYLKGRKVIENNLEMVLSYNGKIVKGYLLNIQTTISASEPFATNFVFTMLIQKEDWFRMNWVGLPKNEYIFNGLSNTERMVSLTVEDDAVINVPLATSVDSTQTTDAYGNISNVG